MEFNYFNCECGIYLNWDKILKSFSMKITDKKLRLSKDYVYVQYLICPCCKTFTIFEDDDFWQIRKYLNEELKITDMDKKYTASYNNYTKGFENIKEVLKINDEINKVSIVDSALQK